MHGAVFCTAYFRGNRQGIFHNDAKGWDGGYFDHDLDRAVVITAETEPNYSSGPAAWTPDEGHTWFPIPGVSGNWAVGFANPRSGWFVGNNGQIIKISSKEKRVRQRKR